MMHHRQIIITLGLFLTIGVARCMRLAPPRNPTRTPSHRDAACRKDVGPATTLRLASSSPDGERNVVVPPPPNATRDDDRSTSLYRPIPSNRPWTFGILTSGFPPQQLLVPIVKFVTYRAWKLMMNELVAHDGEGRFVRESYRAGSDPSPLDVSSTDENDMPTYRLYLGNPCPWCHRVRAAIALLGIEDDDIPITMLIDDAEKASRGGWILPNPSPEDVGIDIADELIRGDLAGVYDHCHRDALDDGERYRGRCTAPLLVNAKIGKIITNESNEIMMLLNDYARRKRQVRSAVDGAASGGIDLRPMGMEMELDVATKRWFDLLWNGSYRCGFATSQIAYDEAAKDVLRGLNEMNTHLASNPYLVGDSITEVDLKNFAWVTRHDYAYAVIFKSPGGRISQYPHISSYVKRMVADHPELLDTTDMADACGSYYRQLFMLNFGRIVPHIPSVREWVAGL